MGSFGRWIAAMAAMAALLVTQAAVAQGAKIESRFANVNGIRMHYLVAGRGDPVILMHGYAQNSYMWRPTMRELAKTHLVVAPDLRGFGDTTNLLLLKDLWHFHFYGPTPLALVQGRERIYFEHFWNDFAADGTKSVSEADRQFYAKKYAQPGAMKAGMEVFRNFDQDAKDNAIFVKTKLRMPMLVLGGEKSGGDFLITQGKMVADSVEGVLVLGSGHWLVEEAPAQVIPRLVEFFNR